MSFWRSTEERDRWAEDHGYQRGQCPRCHRVIHSDGAMECGCGWSENDDEEEEGED